MVSEKDKKTTGYPSVDRPWLKFYSNASVNSPLPACTMYDYVLKKNRDFQDIVAIRYYDNTITYGEFFKAIDETADMLAWLGVENGDMVTICSITTPETIYAIYACSKIGAICNIVEPRANAESIEERVNNTESKVLIVLDMCFHKLNPENIKVNKIVLTSIGQSMDFVSKIGYMATLSMDVHPVKYTEQVNTWNFYKNRAIVHGRSIKAEYAKDSVAAIIYTSGTTGGSKGAMLTDDAINAIAYQYEFLFKYKRGEVFLNIIPPFVAGGLACDVHMPLSLGLTVTIIPRFKPVHFDDYLIKYKPNFFRGAPSYFENFVRSRKLKDADLSYIKVAAMGGDALNVELETEIEQFLTDHGSKSGVLKGYGMTEMASTAATLSFRTGSKLGSVGIPLPRNLISIFEPGTEEELKYGQQGEICISGPSMMKEYYKKPEETEKVIKKHKDGRLWVHTQDVGYIDEEGFIYFTGRIKRIIIRPDGHNVWPSAIEAFLIKQEGVKDCAVIGADNPYGKSGKIPTAFIVKDESCNKLNNELEQYLRKASEEKLEGRDAAQKYFFIDKIPTTLAGKVDYRRLEDYAAENWSESLVLI